MIPVLQIYHCPRGHQYTASAPFAVNLQHGEVTVTTGPLCAWCLAEYLSETFPAQQTGDVFGINEESSS